LAVQAAKYWGLDPEKVFFLDRDSRIVPDGMELRQIVLPPAEQSDSSSTPGCGAGAAASPSSSALVPHRSAAPGHQELEATDGVYPVMEGRNYTLTLVRGGTVLSKEDLSKPKGEVWQDFTFEHTKLEQELENTRIKHGEADGGGGNVNMDDIPSLFDLQKRGKEQKMRRRWDTRCRCMEFLFFLVCEIVFFFIAKPDSKYTLSTNRAAHHIEEVYLKASEFKEIRSSEAYSDYLYNTLGNMLVPPGMNSSNVFVVGALGYLYTAEAAVQTDVNWCGGLGALLGNTSNASSASNDTRKLSEEDEEEEHYQLERRQRFLATVGGLPTTNTSNKTTGTAAAKELCVDPALRYCSNRRVIQVISDAQDTSPWVPNCHAVQSRSVIAAVVTTEAFLDWGFLRGDFSNWYGGEKWTISTTNITAYKASIARFASDADSQGRDSHSAKLIVIFTYLPSLNAMMVYQLVMEHTMSGTVIAMVKKTVISLNPVDDAVYVGWVSVIVLATLVFLMEIRRVFGCPKRFFYEGIRDRWSCWTFIHLLLPVLLVFVFLLNNIMWHVDTQSMSQLSQDDNSLSEKAMTRLFKQSIFKNVVSTAEMITMILMNLILYRFLLMFFPQLQSTSGMVKKMIKPLLSALVFMGFAFIVLGTLLYALFSSRVYEFRNITVTVAATLKLIMGGIDHWPTLYNLAPTSFTIVIAVFWVVITLFLNNLTLAIMLSHKKEKDLQENYNFHSFWSAERGKNGADPKDFNPATVGWDFSEDKKAPKQVVPNKVS